MSSVFRRAAGSSPSSSTRFAKLDVSIAANTCRGDSRCGAVIATRAATARAAAKISAASRPG
ncbi:MAG TPA: hypothetical protein VFJ82_04420 [Longimicrobium sp.]|nr:hypothetical protein [Longimicrobium sp.]